MLRAMLIWFNGQVTLGMNQQKGAIYTFSKSNVIEGTLIMQVQQEDLETIK